MSNRAGRRIDALGLYLTGGSSNTNPDLSLGGLVSATHNRGLGAIIGDLIPAIRIDNVFPGCGEGEAELLVDSDGKLVFTPPDGLPGLPIAVPVGESRIIYGADPNKAVRVFRESGLSFPSGKRMTLRFVTALNGVLSHGNVSDAQRTAGVTTYRATMLKAHGPYRVKNIRLWMPPVSGAQAVYSLATETPVANAIQTIANETTAPSGLVWVTPTVEGSALTIETIAPGSPMGLWIRRVFPAAGTVDPRENFQLAMKYEGA